MWWLAVLVVVIVLLIPTAYAGVIGAPYVPVRRLALKKAFDQLNIGPHDVLVDLGAGDGGVLLEAARRGAKVVGYELSPIMWAIARVRLLLENPSGFQPPPLVRGGTLLDKGGSAKRGWVYLRNFYTQSLPADTTVVFVFLMPKNLPRLLAYLKKQRLPHATYLLSYTFALPNIPPRTIIQTEAHGTIYVYGWDQIK